MYVILKESSTEESKRDDGVRTWPCSNFRYFIPGRVTNDSVL